MCKFNFECYHNDKAAVLLIVDGIAVKTHNNKTVSFANIDLEEGEHTITISKDLILYRWYWWLTIFNFLYVVLRFKNYTGGCLGYDDNFASCTICFSLKKTDNAHLEISLINKNHNMNGREGSYFKWKNMQYRNMIIKSFNINKMSRSLIKRWRIAHGISAPLFCLFIDIVLFYEVYTNNFTLNVPKGIAFFLFNIWSIYILISVFIEKSVKENIILRESDNKITGK